MEKFLKKVLSLLGYDSLIVRKGNNNNILSTKVLLNEMLQGKSNYMSNKIVEINNNLMREHEKLVKNHIDDYFNSFMVYIRTNNIKSYDEKTINAYLLSRSENVKIFGYINQKCKTQKELLNKNIEKYYNESKKKTVVPTTLKNNKETYDKKKDILLSLLGETNIQKSSPYGNLHNEIMEKLEQKIKENKNKSNNE